LTWLCGQRILSKTNWRFDENRYQLSVGLFGVCIVCVGIGDYCVDAISTHKNSNRDILAGSFVWTSGLWSIRFDQFGYFKKLNTGDDNSGYGLRSFGRC